MTSKKVVLGREISVGIRKILRLSNVCAIAIPWEFLRKHGLKPGHEVAVIWNGELRIIPPKNDSEGSEQRSGTD